MKNYYVTYQSLGTDKRNLMPIKATSRDEAREIFNEMYPDLILVHII